MHTAHRDMGQKLFVRWTEALRRLPALELMTSTRDPETAQSREQPLLSGVVKENLPPTQNRLAAKPVNLATSNRAT